jgi:hypothetical protein
MPNYTTKVKHCITDTEFFIKIDAETFKILKHDTPVEVFHEYEGVTTKTKFLKSFLKLVIS